jgi:hypothetical protein
MITIGVHDHLQPTSEISHNYNWSFFTDADHCCRNFLLQFFACVRTVFVNCSTFSLRLLKSEKPNIVMFVM